MKLGAWWQRLAIAIATVGLLCACGSSQSAQTGSANGGGKSLVYAAAALPTTMDPCKLSSPQDAEILPALYGFGVNFKQVPVGGSKTEGDDTVDGEKGVAPWVFASWDVSPDSLVYMLHLRHGIVDSYGNTLKAADVKWELDRIAHGICNFVTTNMNLTDVGKQVSVVDDYTLKVTLPKPDPVFLRMMTINNGMFFGPEARKHTTSSDPWANKWLKTHAPAIGPYEVQTLTPGVQIVLVRNPHYNLGPRPAYAKVIYRDVPQDSNRLALIESGEAQVTQTLTQDQMNAAQHHSGTYVACTAALEFVAGFMNVNSKSPVANLKVRQALAYATPYNAIIQSVYGGLATRMYGMAPSDYPGYIGPSAYPYTTNPAKAKALLAAAGYPHGLNLKITINTDEPELQRSAILLQSSFKQIGVNVSINSTPSSVFYDSLDNRTYGDMALERTFAIVPDYGYHSKLFLNPGPPPNVNWSGWKDAQFDSLLAKQASLPDGTARDAIFGQMQRIFNAQVPWLSIANVPTCHPFAKSVTGYHWHTSATVWFPDLKPST
jgi:peptide/nickel transport system substrate-binding protein